MPTLGPRGTLVREAETGEIMADMSGSEPFVLCRGGRGGWGNSHFATFPMEGDGAVAAIAGFYRDTGFVDKS